MHVVQDLVTTKQKRCTLSGCARTRMRPSCWTQDINEVFATMMHQGGFAIADILDIGGHLAENGEHVGVGVVRRPE